ncbi:protein transport protein Sec24A [Zophobas morio]|uniref:protein transport protein Sec24A n=1 Tax=Zophobas morio TaxID=2755281 RepID=UPI003083BE52
MAQQNLPNGMPPQMVNSRPPFNTNMEKPPLQFNGIHSSHSSRDSSPSTRPGQQVPPSQLPPMRSTIPPSQLPPSRSPTNLINQKMGQLNVSNSNSRFNTSTPNQTLQNPSGLVSAFSPINVPKTDNSAGNQVFRQQLQQPPPPQQPQGNHSPYNSQGQNRTLINHGVPPYNHQIPQNQVLPNSQQTPHVNYNPPFQPQTYQRPLVNNHNQAPPHFQTMSQPKLVQNNNPVAQGGFNYNAAPNMNMPPPPQTQFKTNLHSNRYPQSQPQQPQPNMNPPQFYQQPQQQQHSVTQHGFNKMWGQDHVDLLQTPNILPREKVTPPKVYLGNEVLDSANCSPEVFRCTMTKIPESNSLLQKSRLPLGILIHPFKDLTHLPVIQCNVIVRCRACRTYINPFVFFVDSKRWKCNLCYRVNELPEEFQFDPVSKTYGDPSRRPEIKSSTIEYIAPAEYMLRPPQPAVYLFLFDISRLAVESGYLQSACAVLLEELKSLPGDARTQVGIVAYDSALHFFALGEGLSQPHEMTVLEIDDVFLPCPDNLLVNLKDRADLLTDLLTQLPTRFNNTYDNSSALGPALQAAHKMMAATGGRVTVFQASLPNVGPGALTAREDPSQRASTEVTHLNPANDFYKRLALECSGQQIAVDLFVVNSQYMDMATISGISRFSGGCINHFPLFKASRVLQNERFERCFRRYLTRKIGFEAVMRIRCTRGLSIHTFHGNFFVRSTDLLSLPNVSPDAGFGMQVSIDESLSDVQSVCFQAALLYTSSKGERRIRVHTLCLPICATLTDVIHSADQQCIVGLLAKMAVDRSMQSSLSDAREAFINVAIDILSSYKLSLNMGNGSSSLNAPQCLQLLPLYISALLKSTAFRTGTSTRLDDRVKAMIDMKTKPLSQLIQIIYPNLYPVHNLEEQPIILNSEEEPIPQPPHMQLTARCLDSKGAFLMDTGEHMIMLVCPGVSTVFLNEALGVRDYVSITDEMYELPVLDNLHNQRLHQFINYLNDEKPFVATLHVIRDNSPIRIEFFERLIEDRLENALSYHEFMQHLKTQIK